MINLKINNKEINVKKELTILQAAQLVNIQIPRFCFHEKLSIAGNCRMCLVEILNVNKPAASCALPVADNMQIYTNSLLVKKARESVLELLLINHPLDCPICDQGGECDLQDQVLIFGSDRGRFYETKRAVADKTISPIIKTIMTRCIHCTRCVRFLSEIGGVNDLGMTGRGSASEIGTYIENSIFSELSGNIIDLCPVGALTSKPYAFITRPWELTSIETVDINDSLGSTIRVDVRNSSILRILPKVNEEINEEWITDKIRFSFDGLKNQRLDLPYFKLNFCYAYRIKKNKLVLENFTLFLVSDWLSSFTVIKELILILNMNPTNILSLITGNSVNLESLLCIKNFAYNFGFTNILNQYSLFTIGKKNNDFPYNYSLNIDLKSLASLDVCLLIGTNLRLENPLFNSRLRKAYLLNNIKIYLIGASIELNYPIKKISNSVLSLFLILQGKHKFSIDLYASASSLFLFNSFFSDFTLLNHLYALLSKINLKINISFISSYISTLAFSTFFNNKYYLKRQNTYSKNLFYLIETDEIFLMNKKNSFIIYQGLKADRIVNNHLPDIILPSFSFVEEESTFFNIKGSLASTSIVDKNINFINKLSRSSWKILYCLNLYLINYNISFDLDNLIKYYIKPLKKLELYKNYFYLKQTTKLPINILNNIISNFYMTNSITRDSFIMTSISELRSLKINLNIL